MSDFHTHTFQAFNTVNTVQIYAENTAVVEKAFSEVEQKAAYFERLFSHTLPESSLVRINAAGGKPVEVEPELAELLRAALGYCEATGGLFDITIGPVVALWNQSEQGTSEQGTGYCSRLTPNSANNNPSPVRSTIPPSLEALAEACSHVDYRGVHVNGTTVQLEDPQASIVLGGVAKGYIADALVALLKAQGVQHGIVNLGGNAVVFGGKPDGSPFGVGLRVPRSSADAEEKAFAAVRLHSGSVVTSGIYERGTTAPDGTFYHHILDPRTGMPAKTDLLAATLISATSLDGDGYTTALVVLGRSRATEFVEALVGCEAVFVTRENQVHGTSGIGAQIPFAML